MIILSKYIIRKTDVDEEASLKFKYLHDQSSLISKWTFSWMLPLLWHGFKKPIDVEVLEKVTEQEKSKDQAEKLRHLWINNTEHLFKACLKLNSYLLVMGAFYRLLADVCSLISALSIKWIIKSITSQSQETVLSSQDFWSSPYFVIFIMFTCGLFQGISKIQRPSEP